MPRLLLALLCAISLVVGGCKKAEPEPEGSLEGTWVITNIYPVLYDTRDNELVTYAPTKNALSYTGLLFTSTEVTQMWRTGPVVFPYVRSGNQITCPPQTFSHSYKILKLTTHKLSLYLRGEYPVDPNAVQNRIDCTIELYKN